MDEPTTEQLLTRVLERLERLEARLDALNEATGQLAHVAAKTPVVIEAAATGATWAWEQAEARGIDPIQAGLTAADLAIEAGKPGSLATVKRLLAKQDALHKALDAVEKLEKDGTIDALTAHGTEVLPKVAKLVKSPSWQKMLEHAVSDTRALEVAGDATTALVETRQGGFKPLGLFGQLGMLMDADVQKALGFGLAVAKRFGAKL